MKTILVTTLALLLAMPAYAKPEGRGQGGKGGGKAMAEALGLTPEQQEQITAIRKKHRESFRDLRSQVQADRRELTAALQAPKKGGAYQKELEDKFDKLVEKRRALASSRFHMALEMREILNEEQIAKFNALRGGRHKGGDGEGDR